MYSFLATLYIHKLFTPESRIATTLSWVNPATWWRGQGTVFYIAFHSSSFLLPLLTLPIRNIALMFLCYFSSAFPTSQHLFLTHAHLTFRLLTPFLHPCCLPVFACDQSTLFLFPSLFLFLSWMVTFLMAYMARRVHSFIQPVFSIAMNKIDTVLLLMELMFCWGKPTKLI